jgi:hypothetical protein
MTDLPKLDIAKVERLRVKMLLTKTQMADLLGISRMHYYTLLEASASGREEEMRRATREKVRYGLVRLLTVVQKHQWPSEEHVNIPTRKRFARLKELAGF